MKLAISAILIASVAGFSSPMTMTFSMGKKAAAKKAAPAATKAVVKKAAPAKAAPKPVAKKAAPKSSPSGPTRRSIALPYKDAPAGLDGSLLGDVGFDPLLFSTRPNGNLIRPFVSSGFTDLTWNREAELMHGRIAQIAVLGFIVPGFFGTLPGNEWTGVDAYSYTNPLEAWGQVPQLATLQIILFMSWLEFRRLRIIKEEGANYVPGDQRIGQTGFNPFGLNYTPEQYEEKQLQELKHCRLAMVGIFGLWAQAEASGVSVADQLKAALAVPAYAAKAGYFLPEGI